jgi:hypothetical protein
MPRLGGIPAEEVIIKTHKMLIFGVLLRHIKKAYVIVVRGTEE